MKFKANWAFNVVSFSLLFSALIFAYSNHFYNPFHFDDFHTIADNVAIRSLENWPAFFSDPKTFSTIPSHQSYRPIITLSLAIDYALSDKISTLQFHISMFIVYLAQLVLIYLFFKHLLILSGYQAAAKIALIGTAIYGLHTANAETLNYIISRSDLYSTFFLVLAFCLYQYRAYLLLRCLSLLALGLAVLSKEAAAMYPALLVAYILLFDQQQHLQLNSKLIKILFACIWRTLPEFLVGFGLLGFSLHMSPHWEPGGTSRLDYLQTQIYIIAHYIFTFFAPVNLSADSDFELIRSPTDTRIFLGTLLLLSILTYAIRCSRISKLRPVSFGIAWFFLTLCPTSSIIPLAEVQNDHRIFLPYIGLTLAVTVSFTHLLTWISAHYRINNSKIRMTVTAFLIIFFSLHVYSIRQRNRVWSSAEALWFDVATKSPKNGRGLMNYGLSQMEKGNYAIAEDYFMRALILTPNYSTLHINLGILYSAQNKSDQAEMYFSRAIQLNPSEPSAYYYYARWLASINRRSEALSKLEEALRLSPNYADAIELKKLLLQSS
ncbi:tetratricopeptide repeat protein [bacterium]|nr:tetratricopeptide repeat protein [bacterium]